MAVHGLREKRAPFARRPFRTACRVAVLVALCLPAFGQRLLVCTTTMSAMREASGVYLQSVDSITGVLPGAALLPGTAPCTPILMAPDGTTAALGAMQARGPWHPDAAPGEYTLTSFLTAPFEPAPVGTAHATLGGNFKAACLAQGENPGMLYLVAAVAGKTGGRIDLYHIGPDGRMVALDTASWNLPAAPVAVRALTPEGRVAVLCENESGGMLLHVRTVPAGETVVAALDLIRGQDAFSAHASGLTSSGDGTVLFVAASGYAVDRPSGEPVTWLQAVDTATFEAGAPIELPGLARVELEPLTPAPGPSCWVATHAPGSAFAYATQVRAASPAPPLKGVRGDVHEETRAENSGPTKVLQIPFANVSSPLRIAVDPDGQGAAIAVENRLEIWQDGQRLAETAPFNAMIPCVRWTREGLFLGEGGRLHRLDPGSGQTLGSIQLQTGWIADIAPIPSSALPPDDPDGDGLGSIAERLRGTSPDDPDSDRDAIPDGADPEPGTPSPQLVLPRTIAFRGEAVGRELRGLAIEAPYAASASWNIEYDRSAMPWLVIYPTQGTALPGIVYMGIDQRYADEVDLRGTLRVRLSGTQPSLDAAGSPATVEIRVIPKRNELRRILWVWNETPDEWLQDVPNPATRPELKNLLAAPPFYFSHVDTAGPFLDPLDDYAAVVLDVAAASRGALTRQAMLDYVAGGGALLLVGRYLPGAQDGALMRWLSPLGIQIDTATAVQGAFSPAPENPVVQHAASVSLTDGCMVYADPAAIAVPGTEPSQAILAAREYGYGRIAALASASPLENGSMDVPENRFFAEDLFQWLGDAGRDIEDLDGDGLTNGTEDRNGNRKLDPGETDVLDADTDGDGIPDGVEDLNRGGGVDEGETDPRNPDSDGDGILDGADEQPLPAADAPRLLSIEPTTGPAQGGTRVWITGRNLTPGSMFWFGDRTAQNVRHISSTLGGAETPPYDGMPGDTVNVRARNMPNQIEGVLPDGFRYIERTTVGLALEAQAAPQTTPGTYAGSLRLVLDCGPGLSLGQISVKVQAEYDGTVAWGEPVVEAGAVSSDRHVACRPAHGNQLWVVVSPGRGGGKLLTVPWSIAGIQSPAPSIRFHLEKTRVAAANGVPLGVTLRDATVQLVP
ncbi:MAG: hypothetical protein QG656_501 [Candidatus Hydrogenedentes bacterium]|nr:hypothetical protein [Candidatus Hydrogenedentota bacterium]